MLDFSPEVPHEIWSPGNVGAGYLILLHVFRLKNRLYSWRAVSTNRACLLDALNFGAPCRGLLSKQVERARGHTWRRYGILSYPGLG